MGSCDVIMNGDLIPCNGLSIIRHHKPLNLNLNNKQLLISPYSPPWFDLRVFYVRITNFAVTDSTPQSLTVNHIPLDPETLLELNGRRCGVTSDGIQSTLRRDRVDMKSEEVTFVSTDSVRFTGSIRFEVSNGKEVLLTGALEILGHVWSLKCEPGQGNDACNFLKGGTQPRLKPTLEVYVAGCFCDEPIILSRTLKISTGRKKKSHNHNISQLDPIPEFEADDDDPPVLHKIQLPSALDDMQLRKDYMMEENEQLEHLYWGRTSKGGYLDHFEGEDSHGEEQLSLFNAGIRVGVGISLGICLGVGVGVGLLATTYQKTARTFRKRLF